jgi:hypothetical protein
VTADGAAMSLRAQLEAALLHAGGTHQLCDVVAMLNQKQAQWWERGQGVAVTEVTDHPRLRELNVWLTAGKLDDCLALQPEIEEWARENRVQRIVGRGREGWGRVCVQKMGFRVAGVVVERWLTGS